jgi:hypothetical protein
MKIKYFAPLLFFIVPTVIASALMWPPAAVKFSLIGGFSVMLISMVVTYTTGLRLVLKDKYRSDQQVEK